MSQRRAWTVVVTVAATFGMGACLNFDEQLGLCLASDLCGDGGVGLDGGLDGGPDAGPDGGSPAGATIVHDGGTGTVLAGECWPIHVSLRGPDGGTMPAPFQTALVLDAGDPSTELYAGSDCAPPQTAVVPIAAGAMATVISFRSSVTGTHSVSMDAFGLPTAVRTERVRDNVQHGTCDLAAWTPGTYCPLFSTVKPGRAFVLFSASSDSTNSSVALASCHLSANPTPGDSIYCSRYQSLPDAGVSIAYEVVEHAKFAVYTGVHTCNGSAIEQVQLNGVPDAGSTFLLHSTTAPTGSMVSALQTATFAGASPSVVDIKSGFSCPVAAQVTVQAVDLSALGATVTTSASPLLDPDAPSTYLPGKFPIGQTPMFLYSYQVATAAPPTCAMMLRGWTEPSTGSVNFSRGVNGANMSCDNAYVPSIAYQLVQWPATWTVQRQDFNLAAGIDTLTLPLDGGYPAARTFVIGGGQWSNGTSTGEGQDTTLNQVGDMQGYFQYSDPGALKMTRTSSTGVGVFSAQVVTLVP